MELIECGCGCKEMIPIKNKHGDPAKYKHGHFWRNRKRDKTTGDKHPNWKGGRISDGRGYILLYMPDHPRATKLGYIREHIHVLEQKLGRYLEKGEIPHHINGIKDDNRLENLTILKTHKEHMVIHNTGNQYNKKDHSNTICLLCKSDKTYYRGINKPQWYKYQDGYICRFCYQRLKKPLKRKYEIRICMICGSYGTYIDKRGVQVWFKCQGEFICKRCHTRHKNIERKTLDL